MRDTFDHMEEPILKQIIRQTAALTLALTLSCTAVFAAGDPLFPVIQSDPGFPDVVGHWSAPYVKTCVETGLMKGVGNGFAPEVTLTNGETIAIAARIRAALVGETIPSTPAPGQAWYQPYVDYLSQAGLSLPAPKAYSTRQGFFSLLSGVLPESALPPINNITALPDTRDPAILRFYNGGILIGTDAYGTFYGEGPLSRGECAAMVARVIDPSLRRTFTPAGQVPASPYPPQEVVFTVNGTPIPYSQFEPLLLSLMEDLHQVYASYGLVFDWEDPSGMEDWRTIFKTGARDSLTAEKVANEQSAQLGCPPEDLALTLFGSPTEEEIARYGAEHHMDLTLPHAKEEAAQLILDEKLNQQMAIWVNAAQVQTTPLYDQIDPKLIWELYH